MTAEHFVIATNNVDKIAFGGAEKMVIVYDFGLEKTESGQYQARLEGDPYIALIFNSSIKKIEFFGAN